MPEQIAHESDHEALEANIQYLAGSIRLKRRSPEMKDASGIELTKYSLQSRTAPQAAQKAKDDAAQAKNDPLIKYTEGATAETKLEVEYLVDLAFHKGIKKAVAEARHSSPFVLDAFHDALVGKFYPELKKRGIVD